MVNKRAASPGQPTKFQGEGALIGSYIPAPTDDGSAWRSAAATFSGVAGSLADMADRAAKREGAAAGLAAGAGAGLPDAPAATPAAAAMPAGPSRDGAGVPAATINSSLVDRIIHVESGGNPNAKNPSSSATGAGQFIGSTWLSMIGKYRPDLAKGRSKAEVLALRHDAGISREMVARYTAENATILESSGIATSAGNLYLAHFLGPGGARKLLSASDSSAASEILDGGQVAANGSILRGKTVGQVRAWAERKMGGAAPAADATAAAGSSSSMPLQLSGPPRSGAELVLRRDGTIYGNAFDDAALDAHGWRLEAALHADLGNAYEELKDDPAALNKRMGEIKQSYIADSGVEADPKMREALERSFYEKSTAYTGAVNRRIEDRRIGEAKAAAAELVEAQSIDIERQAYIAGSSPNGDAAVAGLVDRAGRKIDSMIATGALTPAEGMKRRRDLVESATNARIRGAFDALPDLKAKQNFADDLLDQWKQGQGMVGALDFRQVNTLSNELRAAVTKEREGARGDLAIAKAKLKNGVADDLASIEKTGVGALTDGRPIDAAEVAAILGPAEAVAWSDNRDKARKFFETTHGFETMTDAEIDASVAKLAPTPGQEGFARQADLFDKATKKAEAIQKQRREDPAAAASLSFQSVRDAEAAIDPQDPGTVAAMITERMHGQEALGIPELAREPLTKKEALALGREIFASSDQATQLKGIDTLAATLGDQYGPYADDVLRQVISSRGTDRELASYSARVIRKLGLGETPKRADSRGVDKSGEVAAADRAMDGRTDDAAKILGLTPAQSGENLRKALSPNELIPVGSPNMIRTPTAEAIRRLVADKSLAPKFDEAFGPGTARFYLGGE